MVRPLVSSARGRAFETYGGLPKGQWERRCQCLHWHSLLLVFGSSRSLSCDHPFDLYFSMLILKIPPPPPLLVKGSKEAFFVNFIFLCGCIHDFLLKNIVFHWWIVSLNINNMFLRPIFYFQMRLQFCEMNADQSAPLPLGPGSIPASVSNSTNKVIKLYIINS